jgi:hypothetical protein
VAGQQVPQTVIYQPVGCAEREIAAGAKVAAT